MRSTFSAVKFCAATAILGVFLLHVLFVLNNSVDRKRRASIRKYDTGSAPREQIPRIIHQHWEGYGIPRGIPRRWLRSWREKNKGWEYWFWSMEDVRCFLEQEYPWFLPVYDGYRKKKLGGLHQADAMRYFVLYHFGGVYADLDVESLQPLDAWLQHECIIPEENPKHVYLKNNMTSTNVLNAIMMCRPKHPFMKKIMTDLVNTSKIIDVLKSTGPYMITNALRNFEKDKNPEHSLNSSVTKANFKYFNPTYDPRLFQEFILKCIGPGSQNRSLSQKSVAICHDWVEQGLTNIPFLDSFTDHHWTHMSDIPNWRQDKTYNISDVIDDVTTYRTKYNVCSKYSNGSP